VEHQHLQTLQTFVLAVFAVKSISVKVFKNKPTYNFVKDVKGL